MSPAGQAAAHELVAGGGAGATAASCAQCLAAWGVLPEYAAAAAVVLGVLARLALDGARGYAARRAGRARAEVPDGGR